MAYYIYFDTSEKRIFISTFNYCEKNNYNYLPLTENEFEFYQDAKDYLISKYKAGIDDQNIKKLIFDFISSNSRYFVNCLD